jgi:hypothetical protein
MVLFGNTSSYSTVYKVRTHLHNDFVLLLFRTLFFGGSGTDVDNNNEGVVDEKKGANASGNGCLCASIY